MRLGVALSFEVPPLDLDELEEYLKITEEYLHKAKTDFETWFDEKTRGFTPKERNEFYELYGADYWQYAETFPRILRNSLFVSAYSLLEYEMAVICKWLKKDKQLPISLSDLRGDTPDQFKNYCKLACLEFPFNSRPWQEINNYRRIRNCIVHNRGLIKEFQDKDNKGFISYLTKKGVILQDTNDQEIALTEQFCKEVVKTIADFLNKVVEAHDSQSRSEKRD